MKFFKQLQNIICNLTPYFVLAALTLLVINFIDTQKVKKQLDSIQSEVSDLEYMINSIDTEYDNSDVIRAINDATYEITSEINDAESDLESAIIIWR